MNELVKKHIAQLMCLELCCKDGHYQCKGIDFPQLHELFDKIQDGLSEMRDITQEIFFLGRGQDAMAGKEILQIVSGIIQEPGKTNEELIANVKDCLLKTLDNLSDLIKQDLTSGERSLFDDQAKDLQQRMGFLNRISD